jgi:5-methyltetrahydrofolate--homocysteine methyltransferase
MTLKIKQALREGIAPSAILKDGMIAAMDEVGRLFEIGEYYIPEMLVAARAMQSGLEVLKHFLTNGEAHPSGKVAIGTVKGDLHDIGKNLVKMMLEGAGFEVIDLGVDVDPSEYNNAVIDHHIDIVAMLALITTTMPEMRSVIGLLERPDYARG